jgi:hypothetical protein
MHKFFCEAYPPNFDRRKGSPRGLWRSACVWLGRRNTALDEFR